MFGSGTRPWLRRAVIAAAFSTVLIGTSAHASWLPDWWPFHPDPNPAPEIDAGLARSAVAIVAGGLLVLRGRRRSS